MSEIEQKLPSWFWTVPHVGAHFPGAVPRDALRQGGNCQLFAYEVVAYFGYAIPDLRSDELWRDAKTTRAVEQPARLDLVLFAKDADPYGAHVGVVWGPGAVLHLCKEIGKPVIWPWSEFSDRPPYRHIVGFKRPTVPATGRRARGQTGEPAVVDAGGQTGKRGSVPLPRARVFARSGGHCLFERG